MLILKRTILREYIEKQFNRGKLQNIGWYWVTPYSIKPMIFVLCRKKQDI